MKLTRRINSKKGLSPVVATILLIAIVVILAIIIFLWARGFVAERAEKFGRAVELSCEDVNFDTGVFLDDGNGPCNQGEFILEIVNRGDIPLYGFEVKDLSDPGSVIVNEILTNTVSIGQSAQLCLGSSVGADSELLIIPVILGQTDSGKIAHTCPDHLGIGTAVIGV
jgi:flagellin-like protein